ncbi:hypothetical protein [uncultured Clostridium sp.]|uniref:hypothetical protein n=1 Tax=uncultured Clostridium sp. TaxID=59620 RepID=UPI00280BCE91|nr:hypothetical protein [uncultured Clostridium sp.]
MSSLLERFKKIYEEGTSYKVSWSKVDEAGNLTVGIVNAAGEEQFYLNVREYPTGEIYWY